jgi:hypothetical protein
MELYGLTKVPKSTFSVLLICRCVRGSICAFPFGIPGGMESLTDRHSNHGYGRHTHDSMVAKDVISSRPTSACWWWTVSLSPIPASARFGETALEHLPRFLQGCACTCSELASPMVSGTHPPDPLLLLAKTIRRRSKFHPHKVTSSCWKKSTP